MEIARTVGLATADALLQLNWKETGGPPVTAPTKKGFGSRLLERGLPAELEGKATLEPEGLACTIEARLRRDEGETPEAAGLI